MRRFDKSKSKIKWMLVNLKNQERQKRIEKALKHNLKKRKQFLDRIKKKNKK